MNLKEMVFIGSFETKKGIVKQYIKPLPKMVLQRQNTIEIKSITQLAQEIRAEYKELDVFDQAKQCEHFKAKCESEGIDFFLILCQDSHFNYLLKNNLIERF